MNTGIKRICISNVHALLCLAFLYHTMCAYDCPLWADHAPHQTVRIATPSLENIARNFPAAVQELYTAPDSEKARFEEQYRTYMTQLTELARIHMPEILTLISELDAVISSAYRKIPDVQNNRSVFVSQLQTISDALQNFTSNGTPASVILVKILQDTVQLLKNRI